MDYYVTIIKTKKDEELFVFFNAVYSKRFIKF